MLLLLFLVILIAVSWVYWLVVCGTAIHFFEQKDPPPGAFLPAVSLLKPVKGLDDGAYENFVSFVEQDYPDFEILFGVMDELDPVIPVIARLQRNYPEKRISYYIAPPLGSNRKAAILHFLTQEARHSILVLSDSDIRVGPDFLQRAVATLANKRVGLVNCLYRSEPALSIASKVESLLISTFLLPSGILGSYLIGFHFAFGAAIVLRRQALEDIGGFEAIKDHLADDHQLGYLIAKAGWDVVLSRTVVANQLNQVRWHDFWDRQSRWMRVAWVCRKREYPGLLITYSIPLSCLLLLLSGFSAFALWLFIGSIGLRLTIGIVFARLLGHPQLQRWAVLLPIADFCFFFLWIEAMFATRVRWRDEIFTLLPDGRMVPQLEEKEQEELP